MLKRVEILVAVLALLLVVSCASTQRWQSRAKGTLRSMSDSGGSQLADATEEPSASDSEELESLGYSQERNYDMLSVNSNVEAVDGELPEDSVDESSDDGEGSESDSENSAGDEDTEDGEDEPDEDEGASPDAPQLVPGTGLVPRQWPEDITLMPGFEIRYSASDSAGQRIVAFGHARVAEVKDYYLNLEDWESSEDNDPVVEIDDETGEEIIRLLVILNRDRDILTINIVENPDETLVQLLYTGG